MFRSSGYFRGATCPYFASGLCDRPHCHFRHVKPTGVSVESQKAKGSMPESVLSRNVTLPSEVPGHRGLPVTISRPSGSRKSSLLNMVGDAIKQVQIDIDRDKAHLGYSPVVSLPETKLNRQNATYCPTPISKPAEITRCTLPAAPKYKPTAKPSAPPQYKPTPITVLKKKNPGSVNHKHSAKERETDLEYDPKSNYSTRPDPDWVTEHAERITLLTSEATFKRHHPEEQEQTSSKKQKTEDIIPVDNNPIEATFSDSEEDLTQPVDQATKSDSEHKLSNAIAEAENTVTLAKEPVIDGGKSHNTAFESVLAKKNDRATNDEKSTCTSAVESKFSEIPPKNAVIAESNPDDDLVIISSEEERSENSQNVPKEENKNGEVDSKVKNERHSKDHGKDSEKENKSTGHSRHKSSKSDKDRDKSHSKDSRRNSSHHKHSKDKDSHHSKHTHHHSSKSSKHSSSSSRRHSSDSKTPGKDKSSSHDRHSSRSNHVTSHKHSKSKEKHLSSKHNSHSKSTKDSSQTASLNTKATSQKTPYVRNLSHVDLFGDESDDEGCKVVTMPASGSATKTGVKMEEVDSDDVISVASSTFEEEEFLQEAKLSLSDGVELFSEVEASHGLPGQDGTFDECLDYFTDEEEKHYALDKKEKSNVLTEGEGTSLASVHKRVAHNPDHQSLIKTSNINRPKPRPTPAQVMMNRFSDIQKDMRDRWESINKAKEQPALSNSSSEDGNKSPMSLLNHYSKKAEASQVTRKAHTQSGQALKKLGAGLLKKKSSSLLISGASTSNGRTACSTASGKRFAHLPQKNALRRPIVEADNSGKVPTNIRQRYLNNFIDECLKIYTLDQDAFERAVCEEKSVYSRSISKKIYLNLAINAVHKLRLEGSQNQPKGATPHNPRTFSHEALLGGAKAASTSFTLHRCGTGTKSAAPLTSAGLYQSLSTYVLTADQLVQNGFPVPDPLNPGSVTLKKPDYAKPEPKDPLQKTCCRCGGMFSITHKGKYVKQEECNYHWGKSWKRRTTNPEIIQIAAVYKQNDQTETSFSCYIHPPCKMSAQAERVTGFKVTADKLLRNGKELDTCTPKEGLEKFVKWLKDCPLKPLLVAHNCTMYDCPVLIRSIKIHGLDTEFCQAITGMADSLTMVRDIYPGHESYCLDDIASDLRPMISTEWIARDMHEGLSDAKTLLGLLQAPKANKEALCSHSWQVSSSFVDYIMKWTDNIRQCYPSIQLLCTINIIRSSAISAAISGAGYKFEDLKNLTLNRGLSGIRKLLMVDLKCCRNDGLARALVRYFK